MRGCATLIADVDTAGRRAKDIVDLERLIAVQGSALNAAYVGEKLVTMLGPDDDRVRTWDRLLAEHLPR